MKKQNVVHPVEYCAATKKERSSDTATALTDVGNTVLRKRRLHGTLFRFYTMCRKPNSITMESQGLGGIGVTTNG